MHSPSGQTVMRYLVSDGYEAQLTVSRARHIAYVADFDLATVPDALPLANGIVEERWLNENFHITPHTNQSFDAHFLLANVATLTRRMTVPRFKELVRRHKIDVKQPRTTMIHANLFPYSLLHDPYFTDCLAVTNKPPPTAERYRLPYPDTMPNTEAIRFAIKGVLSVPQSVPHAGK